MLVGFSLYNIIYSVYIYASCYFFLYFSFSENFNCSLPSLEEISGFISCRNSASTFTNAQYFHGYFKLRFGEFNEVKWQSRRLKFWYFTNQIGNPNWWETTIDISKKIIIIWNSPRGHLSFTLKIWKWDFLTYDLHMWILRM